MLITTKRVTHLFVPNYVREERYMHCGSPVVSINFVLLFTVRSKKFGVIKSD